METTDLKKLFCISILVIVTQSCTSNIQSEQYDSFRVGEFVYKEKPFDKILVFRDSLHQIEIDKERNTEYKLKINWINDNEYTLEDVSGSGSLQKKTAK